MTLVFPASLSPAWRILKDSNDIHCSYMYRNEEYIIRISFIKFSRDELLVLSLLVGALLLFENYFLKCVISDTMNSITQYHCTSQPLVTCVLSSSSLSKQLVLTRLAVSRCIFSGYFWLQVPALTPLLWRI